MNPNDPNVVMLEVVAEHLGEQLRDDLVFVGDLIAVIDGRDALLAECRNSAPELRAYLRDWMSRLLSTPSFLAALPGHLPGDAASQERAPELEDKLRQIANLN